MEKLQETADIRRRDIFETLWVAVALSFAGGFMDACGYLLRDEVFAFAQTGNMILMSIQLARLDFVAAGYYVCSLTAFFLGIMTTELIKKYVFRFEKVRCEHFVLTVEMLLFVAIGFIPLTVPAVAVNLMVSFISAMQIDCFKRLEGMAYASTMCTGNFRSGTENLFLRLIYHDKAAGRRSARYFLVIGGFCFGAVMGAVLCPLLAQRTVWVCAGVMGAVLCGILWTEKNARLIDEG